MYSTAEIFAEVIRRFQTAPGESGEPRHAANLASAKMGHDYFFGVDINSYFCAIDYMSYGQNLSQLHRGIADYREHKG